MKPNSFGDGLSYATFSGVSFATYTKNHMKVLVFTLKKTIKMSVSTNLKHLFEKPES